MTHQTLPSIAGIDTHAHIFTRDLPLASNRRYSPDYDALVEEYLGHLERCGLSHGVLVQPSFLGTDNSFMLAALRKYPTHLRGIAVVDIGIDDAQLDELQAAGVVGVRLNLVGQPLDDYAQPVWAAFFNKLARRNWLVEIQRRIEDLGFILPPILASGVTVVIDHFALPTGSIDPKQPDHQSFLALLAHEPVWIKLSAAYRSKSSFEQSVAMRDTFRAAYGDGGKFLWGSDWPHTQFENDTHYAEQLSLINALLPGAAERKKVMVDDPARLFKFTQTNSQQLK